MKLVVGPDLQPVAANLLFRDGAPLTGQSDHLVNLQVGIEDRDSVSQATFLLCYASDRITNRGTTQGLLRQPDFVETPGFRLDFVLRQQVPIFGNDVEFKFEARNLTRQDYEEIQRSGDNRIDIVLDEGGMSSLWWATKNEWLGLIDVAELELEALYSGFAGEPYSEDANEYVFVARSR